MSRVSSQSVNDIYDPTRFASDSGIHDDIYTSDSEMLNDSYDFDEESSFDPQRESESEYSFDSERDSRTMPPPPSKSKAEMELRKLTKEELIKKYLELDAIEKELRKNGSKIIRENRELREDNNLQAEQIKVLIRRRDALELEKKELQSTYDLLKARVSDLTGRKPIQGGNNKRIKNVSKRSTASHHHATRRHSSQRKKSGTLRRVQR